MAGPATAIWHEKALSFACDGDRLLGILTCPRDQGELGLVILPGGFQYRAGAHRQNVLLARALADQCITTLRFEGRGMGDSEGTHPGFMALGPDIVAAVSALRSAVPTLKQIVLYGLCDAATAIAMALPTGIADGAILLNPWVRSGQTLAAAQIRTHYPRQILSAAFWSKLLAGRINPWTKLRELLSTVAASRRATDTGSLVDRLHTTLSTNDRPVLLLLSGRDMTAAEFEGEVLPRLQNAPHLTVARIAGADHTFSLAIWWQSTLDHVQDWLAQR